MSEKEIENRIEELENEIAYEKEKMECCAHGKQEILYLESLENELAELRELL